MVNWKNIHQEFTPELQTEWENKGFTYQQTQDWINAGLKPQDASFAAWLRDIKQIDSYWMLNNGNEENFREEYQRYGEYIQPSWKAFYKWLQREIITAEGLKVKIKSTRQNQYGRISIQTLTDFCDSLEATLDNNASYHLFPTFDQNKSFEELFPSNNYHFGKKTSQQLLSTEDYALLEKLFFEWKETMGISRLRTGGKSTREFIENLKKIYENCQVYFDIQGKEIVIKNEIDKKVKAYWDEKESEFRQMRTRIQRIKIEKDVTETPLVPYSWEDFCKEDKTYNLDEKYFQLIIAKLDEWETSQSKKVENVASLIEFLEWFASEEDKLVKLVEEIRKKQMEEMMAELKKLEIEERERRADELGKKLHPDFTLDLQDLWKHCGFNYETCKEWIEAGLKPKDCFYARWLKYVQQIPPSKYKEGLSRAGSDRVVRMIYRQHLLSIAAEEKEEEKEFISKALSFLSEDNSLFEDNEHKSEIENEVKNILLIGRTGSGKSTLANVLVNKNNNFEEVFKESSRSVSETKHVKTEKFTIDLSLDGKKKVNYKVIDTIGFGDTKLDNKDVLKLLKDLVPIIKQNGLNQIFFVTRDRFTKSEIEAYKLLESVLFDKKVSKYTTIVRTGFPEFEKEEECEADRHKLRKENEEIFEVLSNSKIIYVDNPPVSRHYSDIAKIARESSWKRLITYLGTHQESKYYPADLENLNERIDNYITSEEELKREVELKEKIIQEEQEELQKEVEIIQIQKDRELKIVGRNFERQTQELKNQNQKKLEVNRQEFEEVSRLQLQQSREVHNKEVSEIRQTIQNNLSQIRDAYNYVEVGEPICCWGHDKNIQVYDKSGSLIPSYQSDFIGHIYCPTCRETQYNYTLRDAKTYSLEEWSRINSQHAAERRKKMQGAIDEQNRKEREIISRINQAKTDRDIKRSEEIRKREELEQQIINEQKELNEERTRQEKIAKESEVGSISRERENELKRKLENKKRELTEHIRQSKEKRDAAKRELYLYIEQRQK